MRNFSTAEVERIALAFSPDDSSHRFFNCSHEEFRTRFSALHSVLINSLADGDADLLGWPKVALDRNLDNRPNSVRLLTPRRRLSGKTPSSPALNLCCFATTASAS
jgi:hypothetical protein